MLIAREATLLLAPLGWIASISGYSTIPLIQSIGGTLCGFFLLRGIRYAYLKARNIEALGLGDADLLALIGSFYGINGVWVSLFIGSLIGSFVGITSLIYYKEQRPIPFGPFLIAGAILHIIFPYHLWYLLSA